MTANGRRNGTHLLKDGRPELKVEPGKHAWDRLLNEPSRAWEAFVKYRDMGAGRSMRRVAEELGRTRAGYLRQLEYYSSDWHWLERVAAYEAWLDAERQRRRLEAEGEEIERHRLELRKMLDTHIQSAQALFFEGMQLLVGKDAAGTNKLRIDSPRTALDVVKYAVELERLSRGQVTQRTEQDIAVAKHTVIEFGADEDSYLRGLGALAEALQREDTGAEDEA